MDRWDKPEWLNEEKLKDYVHKKYDQDHSKLQIKSIDYLFINEKKYVSVEYYTLYTWTNKGSYQAAMDTVLSTTHISLVDLLKIFKDNIRNFKINCIFE